MAFFAKLAETARRHKSLLCVGLDPDPRQFSTETRDKPDRISVFNRLIIEATRDLVCAYKLNSAFYEAEGIAGLEALQETISYIGADVPIILDVKRSDIGSTSEAYARAAFEVWGADAVTVNPYLGWDALAPFTERTERGVFVLCHTSNPGATDLQELNCMGGPLYLQVAQQAASLPGDNIGLVVGATYPDALENVRRVAPHLWILLPGIGTQGGDLEASLAAGLWDDGLGLIINASRSISQAPDPRQAALDLRAQIDTLRNVVLRQRRPQKEAPPDRDEQDKQSLALALARIGAVRFGEFTLKSGQKSPVYIALRLLVSHPRVLARVAGSYAKLLSGLTYDRLAAIPYAALPIGTAVSLTTGRPLIYPRKEVKAHGTARSVEGDFTPGERVVVLDDLITTGASKIEAIAPLEEAGLQVTDIVVLIDRQGSGANELANSGYRLHAVLTLTEIMEILADRRLIDPGQHTAVLRWLGRGAPS